MLQNIMQCTNKIQRCTLCAVACHRHTYMQKEKNNSHNQACEQPKMLIIGWALTLSTFFFPVLSVYARTQFLVVVTLPLSICDITAWTIWVPNRSELKMGTDYHSTCTKSKAKIHICCTILEYCIFSPGNACHVTSIVIQHTQGQVQWQVANAKQKNHVDHSSNFQETLVGHRRM